MKSSIVIDKEAKDKLILLAENKSKEYDIMLNRVETAVNDLSSAAGAEADVNLLSTSKE
jgi:hypothetical protein